MEDIEKPNLDWMGSKPKTPAHNLKQGEDKMAEVDTTQLSQEHGAIRHDIAVESARLGQQIGSEACGIRAGQGDIRREGAEHAADIRYDVATRAGDIRSEVANEAHALSRQIGQGLCDTDSKILERAGDIRREVSGVARDLGNQIGKGFCDTDSKVLTTGSDIRREGVEHTNEIIKEGLKGDFNTRGDIKDARYDLATVVGGEADRIVDRVTEGTRDLKDRFFTVGRDLADLRQGQVTLAKDVELNALKTQLDAKENTRYLNDRITSDGEKTRSLINDLKYHDLNRGLVERQTELVNCEQDRRHMRDRWWDARFDQNQAQFAGQWAQLQSQIQAFQSQLQETRQGMVNFGTMAGVGQSSTSNNVR